MEDKSQYQPWFALEETPGGASVHNDRCVQGCQEAPVGPVSEQRWPGGAAETAISLQLSSPLAGKQSLLGAQQVEVRRKKGELLCPCIMFPCEWAAEGWDA